MIKKIDEPLLVIKYDIGRLVWRLFFPYSLIFLLFGSTFSVIFSKVLSSACSIKDCFGLLFFGLLLLVSIFSILEMFLTQHIKLYTTKVEKKWLLFGTKSLLYSNTRLRGVTTGLVSTKSFLYIKKPNWYKYKCCSYDENLISKDNKEKAIDILSKISKKSVIELTQTKIEIDPFQNLNPKCNF